MPRKMYTIKEEDVRDRMLQTLVYFDAEFPLAEIDKQEEFLAVIDHVFSSWVDFEVNLIWDEPFYDMELEMTQALHHWFIDSVEYIEEEARQALERIDLPDPEYLAEVVKEAMERYEILYYWVVTKGLDN